MPGFPFDDNRSSGGLVAKGSHGDNAAPLSITEISGLLKRTVEDRFGHVKLRGELSGVKRAASGHLYCALKDEKAVIDGVMWRGSTQRLSFLPEDGIEVVASGKLTTYPGRSKYQIVIDQMEIAGEGALLALLEKTRKRLEAEGLFAAERKRRLPFIPQVIGVVTSPTGAVIRDILHRLADRFPSHVLVWPVMVQGQGAAEQVAEAVRGFGALPEDGKIPRPDLLIVARGGGSIEDLWSFNEEIVIRAIAESSIPVISAVGHETDTTLADFVADQRAPTPTAAAEIAVPVLRDLAATIGEFALRQKKCALRPVDLGRERLEARAGRLPKPESLLQQPVQRLDDLGERLRRGLADRAAQARSQLQSDPARLAVHMLERPVQEGRLRLEALGGRLGTGFRQAVQHGNGRLDRAGAGLRPALIRARIERSRGRLDSFARVLPQLDPEKPLERGFARVLSVDGQTITSQAQAVRETLLRLKFHDAEMEVATGSASVRKPARAPSASPPEQGDLF
ncbi:exodeoxyribonuclease VII large subunit [Altericroceibacterium spongiae]|uniref:Exodeoxyribonuclease 7 large subunit n=1 Tax=Altericroceibacterium spongiae TaxID=2320269 RepID=A0A420EEB5_9SPHN|nr:exodeoxyribonuclease VII large subunit [Altericroceibacterium spongiae]RKF19002.1 exodeoxyribonuclease VII large subunit [Altericroceibacterium spongiae]